MITKRSRSYLLVRSQTRKGERETAPCWHQRDDPLYGTNGPPGRYTPAHEPVAHVRLGRKLGLQRDNTAGVDPDALRGPHQPTQGFGYRLREEDSPWVSVGGNVETARGVDRAFMQPKRLGRIVRGRPSPSHPHTTRRRAGAKSLWSRRATQGYSRGKVAGVSRYLAPNHPDDAPLRIDLDDRALTDIAAQIDDRAWVGGPCRTREYLAERVRLGDVDPVPQVGE